MPTHLGVLCVLRLSTFDFDRPCILEPVHILICMCVVIIYCNLGKESLWCNGLSAGLQLQSKQI